MLQVEPPQIGLYTPVRPLGEGSTMSTYLYRHAQRKKYAVIKVSRVPLTTLEEKEAFLNRAKLLKKLKHRYITEVLDYGMLQAGEPADDYGYLVTQYIEGNNIRERFAEGQSASPDEVRRALLSIADTLQYAHKMFAIHGNLHPGNILQTEKDFFLTDFSLFTPDQQSPAGPETPALLYRAPEHLKEAATHISDQYSLAVMTYEWLCGRRPYQATTSAELLFQQEHEAIPTPSSLNQRISPPVEAALLKALAPDPTARFPQTLTFADTYLRALMGLSPAIQLKTTPTPTADVASNTRPQVPVLPAQSAPRTQKNDEAPGTAPTPSSTAVASAHREQTKAAPPELPDVQEQAPNPEKPPRKKTRTRAAAELNKAQAADQTSTLPNSYNSSEMAVPEPVTATVDLRDGPNVQMSDSSPTISVEPAPVRPPRPVLYQEQAELQSKVDTDLRQGGVLSLSLPGYEERPAQIEMALLVARSITENTPAIIEASTGTGKALDVDTPIPTPTGWLRMGDLLVGDLVFDEQGRPTQVTAAFDIMENRPCYQVVFSDGSTLVADAEHEWLSYTITAPRPTELCLVPLITDDGHQPQSAFSPDDHNRVPGLVTTVQMAMTLNVPATKQANHAIAVAGALTLPEISLPVESYSLGLQLGEKQNQSIPAIYLRASEQQRRALLAGLLASGESSTTRFTTSNLQRAEDVYELLCSLGLQPSQQQDSTQHASTARAGQWTLTFTSNEAVFCPESRTRQAHSYSARPQQFRYVTAILSVPSRPVRCIQVAAASHLYLAGKAMIPTHNSLSYLIPTVRSGKVAIISTANKALQEQLFYKDIPFVQKYIHSFDAALVKGMGNYICLDRVDQEHAGIQYYVKNQDFIRLLRRIKEHDEHFAGDFETLGFSLPADLRSKINADRDQCSWHKCNYYSDCYVRKMKTRAGQARIIVVNHTLLLLDALMEGYLLPERDVIVVDEAHHLEEEATRAFTITISQAQVSTLLAQQLLKTHTPPALQDETKETMNHAWERLHQITDVHTKGRGNLKEPLQEGLYLASVVTRLADALRTGRPKDLPEKEEQLYDKLITRAQNLADNVRIVFSVNQQEKYVYYVERINTAGRRGLQQLEVSAAPLEVTSWLKEQLFDKSNVICTSATLATIGPDPAHPEAKGPNFAYFRRRVGLDYNDYPNIRERILPLTFDYQSQALLYLPRHLPEPAYGTGPAALEYTNAIGREMIKLVEASRGRAFLLFSSKRMLDEVYETFQRELPTHLTFPLLRQGDLTRIELVRSFREREGAVLFGLKSFWEGVDIAGEALSLVVIDKLPFDPPDDPVHEARVSQMKAAGENWFGTYVLPQTVLRLKQGLGRLLRSHDDRGVMAILDTRLYTKSYGKQIVQALPPARRTANLDSVIQFFNADEDDDDASF